jgi:glutamate-1-semialdehyde aminotransferase
MVFLRETARRGVLIRRGGLLFVTYSHTEADVEQTLTAVDEALAVVAE